MCRVDFNAEAQNVRTTKYTKYTKIDSGRFAQRESDLDNLVFADEVYAIQGAIFEVYKTLGSGFLEGVYQEALELELASRGIPYKSQPDITISYKGTQLRQTYRADIICYESIIFELKAVKQLLPEHSASCSTIFEPQT